MLPAAAIAALDRQLAAHGADAVLRRYAGEGAGRVPTDLALRAFVRGATPEEIAAGLAQTAARAVLSPTPILAAAWPGPQDWPAIGDYLVVAGRPRRVMSADVIRMGDAPVRIDLGIEG